MTKQVTRKGTYIMDKKKLNENARTRIGGGISVLHKNGILKSKKLTKSHLTRKGRDVKHC